MKIEELKEKLLTSVDLWADARIDEMVKCNPMLAIPSVYMKRAAHNVITQKKDSWGKQLDNATLFLADENGEINADSIFEDLMEAISIDLPENIVTAILLGSKRSLTFNAKDFEELKNLITA